MLQVRWVDRQPWRTPHAIHSRQAVWCLPAGSSLKGALLEGPQGGPRDEGAGPEASRGTQCTVFGALDSRYLRAKSCRRGQVPWNISECMPRFLPAKRSSSGQEGPASFGTLRGRDQVLLPCDSGLKHVRPSSWPRAGHGDVQLSSGSFREVQPHRAARGRPGGSTLEGARAWRGGPRSGGQRPPLRRRRGHECRHRPRRTRR